MRPASAIREVTTKAISIGGGKLERPDGTRGARVIQVIETTALKGLGTEKDPAREVTQYWSLDGKCLATFDPHLAYHNIEFECKNVKESLILPA